jgi:mannosylglycerate hydrolase
MARRVHIVPHTHWDREWYSPFQTFRLKLVDLLDELLPELEADPSYAHFLLDGQMAVVDDYLDVRPEAEERLRRLAATGRVAMGPWYALPDEFLVSGETLVRNLQRGLHAATRFGGAMPVGYLPDMFGHVAQMPQLLRLFGFGHAVVWRGVPSAVDRSGFTWRSPDGSEVRAEYLPQGYGNGALIPDDAKALVRRVRDFEDEHGDLLTGPILWMNGSDHLPPQPYLGRVVAEANDIQDDYELVVCSLADHVLVAPTEGLPVWDGEMRSGARANLLMGVASNRVDVKQAAAVAERAVERLAEPLSALFLPADRWPGALLDQAWLELIRNSAHDSICACSVDEVCDAVLHRYAEATHIADGLAERAVATLGASVQGDGVVVVNPSSRARSGLVELRLPGEGTPRGCQLLSERPAERVLLDGASTDVATIMAEQLEYTRLASFALETVDGEVLLQAEREPGGPLVSPSVRLALRALRDERPEESVRVRVQARPSRTVLARIDDVPGYGWSTWAEGAVSAEPVRAEPTRLSNGVVTVEVDPEDGTFSIDGHAGLGALIDDGDVGDTYNWCPPASDVVVDRPVSVEASVVEDGPLRARVLVVRRLDVPERVVEGARTGSTSLEVRTTLELRAGEDVVRVQVDLDNHGVRDHRLRAWFPLPTPAVASRAECAFAVVERGLYAEGGPSEAGLPTFPSRRFVQAGGLTLAHEGLLEYELVDVVDTGARALALTLVRATGMLSQGPMTTRPLPAGPMTPMEGPQVQHPLTLRFALHVGDRDPYAITDDAFVPLLSTRAGGGDRPSTGQALRVEGAEVSAVVREGGTLHVRLFNPTPEPAAATIEGREGWLVDLRGRPVAPFEESIDLGPWQIVTAAIAPRD